MTASGPAAVAVAHANPSHANPFSAFFRLLVSELGLMFGRKRNIAGLVGLALVPVLIGTVLFVSRADGSSGGPEFLNRVTENGLFLVLTALIACLPLLLPLAVSIVAGDAIAGEAQTGTLRYLLTVPVPRTRLLAVKATSLLIFVTATVFVIALSALVTGAAYFGAGDMTLLTGTTVSPANAVLRLLGIAVYVTLSLTGLVAVGMFFSTMTEVPVAAMAATVVVSVVSNVLESLPQLASIHPMLLTHHWLDFGEFLRDTVDFGALGSGLLVQVVWVAIFGSLAWARFTTADISS